MKFQPGLGQQQNGAIAGSQTKDKFAHLPPMQKSIIAFLESQPQSDEGTHVAAIARSVGGEAHMIRYAISDVPSSFLQ
jgi:hypothetical protein